MPDMSWFHWYEFMVLPYRNRKTIIVFADKSEMCFFIAVLYRLGISVDD
jgi:hypothetical protein